MDVSEEPEVVEARLGARAEAPPRMDRRSWALLMVVWVVELMVFDVRL